MEVDLILNFLLWFLICYTLICRHNYPKWEIKEIMKMLNNKIELKIEVWLLVGIYQPCSKSIEIMHWDINLILQNFLSFTMVFQMCLLVRSCLQKGSLNFCILGRSIVFCLFVGLKLLLPLKIIFLELLYLWHLPNFVHGVLF